MALMTSFPVLSKLGEKGRKEITMKLNTKRNVFAVYMIMLIALCFLCHDKAYADITGVWDMTSSYTDTNGSAGKSTEELTFFQNGTEIIADSVATSSKNRAGRHYGKIIDINPGIDTIAKPIRMIQFTRVDIGRGNYVAVSIGFISGDDKRISGYFIDVNGIKGTFVMIKR